MTTQYDEVKSTMGYLQEFSNRISTNDFTAILQLWEEYCAGDQIDTEEILAILNLFKESTFATPLGKYIELLLPLWEKIEDENASYQVLKLIVDIQTSNSDSLAQLTFNTLKEKFGQHKYFNEKIRLINLRNQENFQGAISNYELLTHLDGGKYVYHTTGWGTGEIIDVSLVREELALEFENVLGKKDISFENAFKNLIPLSDDHFLARRFGNPDELEAFAKAQPVEVVRMLLRDLGDKTAADIKEELFELVIPANDWTKWWQTARTKVKKDTMIETPANVRSPFRLRKTELSHEDRLETCLSKATTAEGIIQTVYQHTRDFSETLKNPEFKKGLKEQLLNILKDGSTTEAQKLQIHILLETMFQIENDEGIESLEHFILKMTDCENIIQNIEIIAFKKRALVAVKEFRSDWLELFLELLLKVPQSIIKDYILKELDNPQTKDQLIARLTHLVECPTLYPEAFVWYFQKAGAEDSDLPFSDPEGVCTLFESFLILYHYLEHDAEYRDLVKKMYNLLSNKRYSRVRYILKDSTVESAREILLLVTKCQTLSSHDVKILHSLAEVVHPNLSSNDKLTEKATQEENVIWTTQEGFAKVQERIHQIGTVETVENAREIEAARALGDLRENSEYKFALEKRSRLQAELKLLSDQMNKARILTKEDVVEGEVGVGVVVSLKNTSGKTLDYTILGPWEADPDQHILSFQSKFAQMMKGHKKGDAFSFQGEEYVIEALKSAL